MARNHSWMDKLLVNSDHALRSLNRKPLASIRPSPSSELNNSQPLSAAQQKHVAGLMRINHAGEVCAQALYQGQALTAKSPSVKTAMQESAIEEEDHLAWCAERIEELGSHTSYLNPLWYSLSFSIGAAAGLIGDKVSLGFVAATEKQVCRHLQEHLQQLPPDDIESQAILNSMLEDEAKHAQTALEHGGIEFPAPIQQGMTLISKLMTKSSYRL